MATDEFAVAIAHAHAMQQANQRQRELMASHLANRPDSAWLAFDRMCAALAAPASTNACSPSDANDDADAHLPPEAAEHRRTVLGVS